MPETMTVEDYKLECFLTAKDMLAPFTPFAEVEALAFQIFTFVYEDDA